MSSFLSHQKVGLGDNYQNMIMPMTVCAPEQADTEDWGQVFTAQQAWCQNAR